MKQGPEEKTHLARTLLAGQPPVLGPGHTFGTVTDKIADASS